ncbi:hypothetical protein AC482_06215 [miscellaneous Crenarchaeota group-15 archaeon DG-45]|uniref:Uncharacterized protein n=1 Tax=miscellaneous Crenarchaeota group-15 archaeon DG-45 TaxID=1685127 RepID=A0A0M0BM89_9ARCH|nr:MAG: hypothetical protein AC482_06215 [miscellaneous Crenarchaeota group-15 archaeon DG-45]
MDMTWLDVSASTHRHLFRSAAMHVCRSVENVKFRVNEFVTKIRMASAIEFEGVKEEIWADLSAIYYKYEDSDQKKAFREVIYDIFEKIGEDKWDAVYKKLNRIERGRLFK